MYPLCLGYLLRGSPAWPSAADTSWGPKLWLDTHVRQQKPQLQSGDEAKLWGFRVNKNTTSPGENHVEVYLWCLVGVPPNKMGNPRVRGLTLKVGIRLIKRPSVW